MRSVEETKSLNLELFIGERRKFLLPYRLTWNPKPLKCKENGLPSVHFRVPCWSNRNGLQPDSTGLQPQQPSQDPCSLAPLLPPSVAFQAECALVDVHAWQMLVYEAVANKDEMDVKTSKLQTMTPTIYKRCVLKLLPAQPVSFRDFPRTVDAQARRCTR